MLNHRVLCCALCAGLLTTSAAQAGPFSQMVVFGDSLSDVGNAYDQLGTLAQDPDDYYMGRFSNGPVWIEYLSQHLQLPQPIGNNINNSGRNYAFGGAWTDGSGFVQLFIRDIDEQVDDYLDNDGGPTGDELFVLLGGANDFFNGETNTQTPVNNLTSDITSLYNAGARSFMVVNLPLLGQTPRYNGGSDEAIFDTRTAQFNTQLDASLNNLQNSLAGTDFFRIDAAQLISNAIASPSSYGFTNVTSQALGKTGIDPDEYLFWDNVHPTTRGHSLLADAAAQVLFDTLYSLPGDLDLNGFVGVDDLNIVLSNWNTNVAPNNPLFGDITGDGFVGVDDLNTVLVNWNNGAPTTFAVPEPASVVILLCISAPLIRRPI